MSIFTKYKTFDEVIPDYLAERKIILKPRTYAGYVGRLHCFGRWLYENNLAELPLKKLDNQIIAKFFLGLADRLDKPTCNRYYITLRLLWKYAEKIHQVKEFPFDLIVFPRKKGDYSPGLIPKEVFESLMKDIHDNDFQLYVACMMVYLTFVRPRNELRLLRTDDFNFKEGYIRILEENAKTGRTRYATMTKELEALCRHYGIDSAAPGLFIFGTKGKIGERHVGVNSFANRFNIFRDKHNIPKSVKFYSFKHTGMTDMLNSGMPLPAVQNQAGHLRLSSTQHYVKKYCSLVDNLIKNYKRI